MNVWDLEYNLFDTVYVGGVTEAGVSNIALYTDSALFRIQAVVKMKEIVVVT